MASSQPTSLNWFQLLVYSPGVGDITSTLVFIAAAEHDGVVIQCTDGITPLSVSLAGMSSRCLFLFSV